MTTAAEPLHARLPMLDGDPAALRSGIVEALNRRRVSGLTLIAGEVARAAGAVLAEWVAAQKKLKDARPPKDVADDVAAQIERLVPKRFLVETPWSRLAHLPRYLKAIVLRLDKLKADPARDAARMAELRPLEQRHLRKLAERRGSRVSFFSPAKVSCDKRGRLTMLTPGKMRSTIGRMVAAPSTSVSSRPRRCSMRSVKTWPRSKSAAS